MKISDNDIIVKSWSELCDRLYEHSWKSTLGRYRTDYAFRGLSDKRFQLTNSFVRNCGTNTHLEYHLLRSFRKYAQLQDSVSISEWRLLTIAQHYGLPTRLLDWTYSPFVAAHFATDDTSKYDRDGVIWNVDFVRVNRMLPDPLKPVLKITGSNAFTIEMIEEAVKNLRTFDNLDPENLVIFFEPPSIDSRIVNQFAFFSVMSSASAILDDWLLRHPDFFRRIIIPKGLKWEVRDKLDQANITERILFPGLDGLADWLRRYYHPKEL
jgi:hypothetical protein